MYRALTWSALRVGIDPEDESNVVEHLNSIDLECVKVNGLLRLQIDGFDPGEQLKSPEVNNTVSIVSAIEQVRIELVKKQRNYLLISDIVMEGRDIGSVVFQILLLNFILMLCLKFEPNVEEVKVVLMILLKGINWILQEKFHL